MTEHEQLSLFLLCFGILTGVILCLLFEQCIVDWHLDSITSAYQGGAQ